MFGEWASALAYFAIDLSYAWKLFISFFPDALKIYCHSKISCSGHEAFNKLGRFVMVISC
jgi:hypothetical protein